MSKNTRLSLPRFTSLPMSGHSFYASDPDPAFFNFFKLSNPKDGLLLWQAYQTWRKQTEEENYRRFYNHLHRLYKEAETALKAWNTVIPNGKKGEKFKDFYFNLPDCISEVILPDLENIGLEIRQHPKNPRLFIISGTATEVGDFSYNIKCKWKGHVPSMELLNYTLTLTINPDPRELWKDIPTPADIEYYKKEADSEFISIQRRILLAGSTRGRSHAHKGAPRDDDFSLDWNLYSGWHILAVADGAGSAGYSRKGSEIACKTCVNSCAKNLNNNKELDRLFEHIEPAWNLSDEHIKEAKSIAYKILPQSVLEAFKNIREEAQGKGREPKAYATTILLCVCKKFQAGWAIITFQIGDGCIGLLENKEQDIKATLLAEPDEGEFGGQTRFITMPEMLTDYNNIYSRINVVLVKDFLSLILMTDGVSDAKFGSLKNMKDSSYWKEIWQELLPIIKSGNPEKELLNWLGFWSVGNHDDRTLALLANL